MRSADWDIILGQKTRFRSRMLCYQVIRRCLGNKIMVMPKAICSSIRYITHTEED